MEHDLGVFVATGRLSHESFSHCSSHKNVMLSCVHNYSII